MFKFFILFYYVHIPTKKKVDNPLTERLVTHIFLELLLQRIPMRKNIREDGRKLGRENLALVC